MKRIAVLCLCGTLMGGCATKRFGRMAELSPQEASYMDCNDVRREIAECESFLMTVSGDSFSGADILGILGDFGIGNIMEKSSAVKSGKKRLEQLYALSERKGCGIGVPDEYAERPKNVRTQQGSGAPNVPR